MKRKSPCWSQELRFNMQIKYVDHTDGKDKNNK